MKAALCLVLALWTLPAVAGDASGLDAGSLERCLAGAASDGARLDCAGAGQEACLTQTAMDHPDLHPVDRELACIDAERQWWDQALNDRYAELKAIEVARGADRAQALTAMQRDWIAFRDARCAYDGITNGRGTGGAVAEPLCVMRETARQVILLMAYQRDRT